MSNTEFRFENPKMFLLLIPAVLLIGLMFFLMPKRRRKMPSRIISMILHCLLAALIVATLVDFSVVRTTNNQAVILLVDHSDSTLQIRESVDAKARELEKQLQKNATVQTVVFGGDCARKLDSTPKTVDSTDISAALEYAAGLLPDDKVGRIVLVSDGRETDGDAAATALYLQSQGVRVDTVWVDSSIQGREAQIADFTAPQTAFVGQTVTLTATIESNSKSTMIVSVHEGSKEVYNRQFTVDDTGTVLAIEVPVEEAGVHEYRLVMKADQDTLGENSTAVTSVLAVEKPQVLLVTSKTTNSGSLEKIMATDFEVTKTEPGSVPRKITELCNYDAVILMDAHAEDLPRSFGNLLDTYVSVYGRSLFAIGGTETFMYGAMRNSIYEELMPVTFSLSRTSEDDSVALMLVMDCSLSMSQNSAYMSVAKQGAIKCVESMTENDYVGIISFNQEATLEAQLERNTQSNKDNLNRIIAGMTTSKGTYYTDALRLAHEELLKSDAEVRHILFVSDGGPADTQYEELFPDIVDSGITVSTIALGHESTVLSNMATNCGGSYYYVQEATDVPNIMLSLTQHVTVNSLMTGTFNPKAYEGTTLQLPESLPQVSGYLGTTIKRGSELHITLEEDHPLLASRIWGNGKVTCFLSDLEENWCSQWLKQPELVLGMLKSAMPVSHCDSTLQIETEAGVRSVQVYAKTADTESYVLNLQSGDYGVQMISVSPGLYKATLPVDGIGSYGVTITQNDMKGNFVDELICNVHVPVNKEYDVFSEDGQTVMKLVSMNGGGLISDNLQELGEVTADEVNVVADYRLHMGVAFAVLLLLDIVIRKLRWKDLKNLFLSASRKK